VPIIILVTLLLTATITGVLIFLPIHPISTSKSYSVPYRANIHTLNLNLSADIAQINVAFEDMTNKLIMFNVSATGGTGILAPSDILNVSFSDTYIGSVVTVTSQVHVDGVFSWYPWLNLSCDVRINPSLTSSLNVKTSVGRIVMNTKARVVLNSLDLETTTGEIRANLAKDVAVSGNVSVRSTTGSVEFSWDNVRTSSNISVKTQTTTGGIRLNVIQNETMPANATMSAEAVTGGVRLNMAIHDSVGARIESTVTTGGINVHSQVGFDGAKSPLQSTNYPASGNFNVAIKTVTGGITLDAEYTAESTIAS